MNRLREVYTALEGLNENEHAACLAWLQERACDSAGSTERQLGGLIKVAHEVNRSFNLDAVMNTGLKTILDVLEFNAGAIYLADQQGDNFHLACAHGIDEKYRAAIQHFGKGEANIGRVGESGKSLFIPNLTKHSRAIEATRNNGHLKSFYFTALKARGKVVGVMPVGLFSERIMSAREMEYIDHLGSLIALAVDRSTIFNQEQLLARNARALYRIESHLMEEPDINRAAKKVLKTIKDYLGYDYLILALKREGNRLSIMAHEGYDSEEIPDELSYGEGVMGHAAKTMTLVNVPDVHSSKIYIKVHKGVRSEIAIPIRGLRHELIGVLNVESTMPDAFMEKDLEVLHSVANQLSVAIRNARHRRQRDQYYDELQAAYMGTLHLFADFIENTFPFLAGHNGRVSDYAVPLAELLGMDKNEVLDIRIAAELHDIGKIYVPREILLKPGSLNDAERRAINEHPQLGSQMVSKVPIFKNLVAPWIELHHERMDGTGYPHGLKGEEIPLASRIISVADAWDAMTSERPYRKALSKEVARAELLRCAGKQFDAEVVDLFIHKMARIVY